MRTDGRTTPGGAGIGRGRFKTALAVLEVDFGADVGNGGVRTWAPAWLAFWIAYLKRMRGA